MGMFVDVPPLDERVLTPAAIDFMMAIRDLEARLITPTVARINRKLRAINLTIKRSKTCQCGTQALNWKMPGLLQC